jgi:hypothetical protein
MSHGACWRFPHSHSLWPMFIFFPHDYPERVWVLRAQQGIKTVKQNPRVGIILPIRMPERRAAFWVTCPWPCGLAGFRSICKQTCCVCLA